MMPSHPPKEDFLSRMSGWFADAWAMPRRIRRLAHSAEMNRDPRPHCRSCGEGRIGNLRPSPDPAFAGIGSCTACGALFGVDLNGGLGRVIGRDAA